MKRLPLLALIFLALVPATFAGGKKKPAAAETAASPLVNDNEIHWLTVSEAEAAMKKAPRKVWIDFYTGWCGWCKVMDKKTFSNPNVIQYMNEHFYAIKIDAEQKEPITFQGKEFIYLPEQRVNQFAVELMRGQLSYPTSVFLEEGFQTPMAIPGYQDVAHMEMILKYLAEGIYKKTPFPEYQQGFVPSWN
jgi:thioredoxin-related protein